MTTLRAAQATERAALAVACVVVFMLVLAVGSILLVHRLDHKSPVVRTQQPCTGKACGLSYTSGK